MGGLAPYAPRQLNPVITAVRVDAPPGVAPSILPAILSAWIPPDVPPQNYPPQPYRTKLTLRLGRSRGFIIT